MFGYNLSNLELKLPTRFLEQLEPILGLDRVTDTFQGFAAISNNDDQPSNGAAVLELHACSCVPVFP